MSVTIFPRTALQIAREIVGALRACDEPRARDLIEEAEALYGGDDYGREALVAEVQRLAREAAAPSSISIMRR